MGLFQNLKHSIMKTRVLSFYYHNGIGWVRIFGKGLSWKNLHTHILLFGERNGYTKGIRIGKWYVSILK